MSPYEEQLITNLLRVCHPPPPASLSDLKKNGGTTTFVLHSDFKNQVGQLLKSFEQQLVSNQTRKGGNDNALSPFMDPYSNQPIMSGSENPFGILPQPVALPPPTDLSTLFPTINPYIATAPGFIPQPLPPPQPFLPQQPVLPTYLQQQQPLAQSFPQLQQPVLNFPQLPPPPYSSLGYLPAPQQQSFFPNLPSLPSSLPSSSLLMPALGAITPFAYNYLTDPIYTKTIIPAAPDNFATRWLGFNAPMRWFGMKPADTVQITETNRAQQLWDTLKGFGSSAWGYLKTIGSYIENATSTVASALGVNPSTIVLGAATLGALYLLYRRQAATPQAAQDRTPTALRARFDVIKVAASKIGSNSPPDQQIYLQQTILPGLQQIEPQLSQLELLSDNDRLNMLSYLSAIETQLKAIKLL